MIEKDSKIYICNESTVVVKWRNQEKYTISFVRKAQEKLAKRVGKPFKKCETRFFFIF